MKIETLRELLIDELQDLYSAEQQITKALPKLAKTAHDPNLKKPSSITSKKPEIM